MKNLTENQNLYQKKIILGFRKIKRTVSDLLGESYEYVSASSTATWVPTSL